MHDDTHKPHKNVDGLNWKQKCTFIAFKFVLELPASGLNDFYVLQQDKTCKHVMVYILYPLNADCLYYRQLLMYHHTEESPVLGFMR